MPDRDCPGGWSSSPLLSQIRVTVVIGAMFRQPLGYSQSKRNKQVDYLSLVARHKILHQE